MTTFIPNRIAKTADREPHLLSTVPHKVKTFSAPITFDLDSSGKLTDNVESSEPAVLFNGSEPVCQVYKCVNLLLLDSS